ncbi:MAG TPA: glycosyltransferase [Leptolyngbyaceae cyanobacterium]
MKFDINRHIMLFDVAVAGHHANYIRHLTKYWCERDLQGSLYIVVSPTFIHQHSDVLDIPLLYRQKNVFFISISRKEEKLFSANKSRLERLMRAFQEWQLMCKYANSLTATHCLIMYFDILKLPLAFRAKPPCPVSGIYFQPKFYYRDFKTYLPSQKELIQQQIDKFILSCVLQNPELNKLFCLDPFAIDKINKCNSNVKAIHLPDPVFMINQHEIDSAKQKEILGIQADRQVFMLFGSLTRRKGIQKLLEAVTMLPQDLGQKLCLVLLGVPEPIEEKPLIASWLEKIYHLQSSLQIITKYEYIPETDVHKYFHMADVILIPYQRQAGMSGILLLAASTCKPVLSTNYGLIGALVQQYNLGLTVDTSVAGEIAKGLTAFLSKAPSSFCDISQMQSFVQNHTPEKFASIIFENI